MSAPEPVPVEHTEVPLVNLTSFLMGEPEERVLFVEQLGDAIRELGFVRIAGHGISPVVIEPAYAAARAFFALPEETRRAYLVPGGAGERGYTPFGAEHAKDNPLPDLKEFWHTGRELPEGDPLAAAYQANLWPKEVDDFRDAMLGLYRSLEEVSVALLQALALYMDQPMDVFTSMTHKGNSILRALHYPPLTEAQAVPGAVRASAHEDINFITLLITATSSGLEILTRDGRWMAVNALPGEIVADAGDMLHRITNGLIPATTHRVVNPDDSRAARYSMPFFVHPRPDTVLRVLDACRGPDFPEPPPDITGRQYLQERLAQLGLM